MSSALCSNCGEEPAMYCTYCHHKKLLELNCGHEAEEFEIKAALFLAETKIKELTAELRSKD